jgi:hypothetical protein
MVKVAVTDRACVMETVQVPVPVHAPVQPVKAEPLPAVAVNVTLVVSTNEAVQVAPQLIPLGLEEIEPVPVPLVLVVRVQVGTVAKVAVTDRACVMETVQVPVPVQAPLQPVKADPLLAVAVNVTLVVSTNEAVQVAPQVMPLGLDEIEPEPVPAAAVVSVQVTLLAKVAVTVRAWVMGTVQVPVPVHAPDQPVKRLVLSAIGVRVTVAPSGRERLQVEKQVKPDGLDEAIDPPPVPVVASESVCDGPNSAVTLRAWLIVTTQAPTPVQAPLHPMKAPDVAVGTSCSVSVEANDAVQPAPEPGHVAPVGTVVIVPVPVPVVASVSVFVVAPLAVAVPTDTDFAASMVNVHDVAVPEQSPPQLENW